MKYILLSIIAIFAAIDAKALTLHEARQLAEENHPLVRDYDLIRLTEQYTVENAARAWLPQIGVSAQATLQSGVAAYPDVLKEMLNQRGLNQKGMGKFQWKGQVNVQQTIWDGGRIKASQDLARRESEENRLANEVELYQIRNRIDDIYFGILLLSMQKEAVGNSISLLKSNSEKINSLVRNGAAMQSDADAINAETLSCGQQLISVESAIDAYRSVLRLYIGDKADEPLEEPDYIEIPVDNNSSLRPEQMLMTARQATLESKRNQVNKESMPHIGAFAQGSFGYPGMNFMEAMMNRNPSFNAMAGLSVSWDISPMYTRKNKLLALKNASDRITVAREVFGFNTDIQATQQRTEINRLQRISDSDKTIVQLRSRVRNASEARLREGIVEPTDLLLRITDEKNAVLSANSHRIEYLKAIYQLKNIVNQ